VPPKAVVDKLHAHGVYYMNMVGHVKHIPKCLALGVDIICAQGGEGGGHTGDIPTTVLIPAAVDLCRKHNSPMTGKPVQVVAAGGIHNGQLLAAALMMGAGAVWVGTRFILTEEAGASAQHKEAVRTAGHDDNIRTLVYSGRPMRVRTNPYLEEWEGARKAEQKELLAQGHIPYEHDLDVASKKGDETEEERLFNSDKVLMGKCAAVVNELKPAKAVVDEFVDDAVAWMKKGESLISRL
jgi:NAD(P)H-dependent flavin oxidoreductase YrpB (nitropropane dioxygenase family)